MGSLQDNPVLSNNWISSPKNVNGIGLMLRRHAFGNIIAMLHSVSHH
jgi:hypothetical protein